MTRLLLSLGLLVAMLSFPSEADAVCCDRKGDFGCCGNGPCNIFCCNCDNGCNTTCEGTHCTAGEWLECAAVCTACATACVVTEGDACIDCMGPLWATCSKCYSGTEVAETVGVDPSDLAAISRDHFFADIAKADGHPGTISRFDFNIFVENEKHRTGIRATTASKATMFRAFDVNRDRLIDRDEFDNDEVTHGLLYPRRAFRSPLPPPETRR